MGDLAAAFERSVKANADLKVDLDAGLVEVGRRIAAQIDKATAGVLPEQEATKALYLTPHLMNVLKEMFATPASRKAAGMAAADEVTTPLDKLRGGKGLKAVK